MARRRPIWTLDCETDPFEKGLVPRPFIWGIYDGENSSYWQFETGDQVAEFLRDKRVIVYAHNGGKFDYHYLRPHMNTNEPVMVINGRMAKFFIGAAEMRDSFCILPVPLRHFKKDKFDYSLLHKENRDLPANRKMIEDYLRSDCVNLYHFVTDFIREYGLHLTQAGAAMRYWQTNFCASVPTQTREMHQKLSAFYYGGRVECFAAGIKSTPFSVADINSAYPFAMTSKHPYCAQSIVSDRLPPAGRLGLCLVKLDAIARGCFPLRDEKTGEISFPDDARSVREYNVTGWELEAALETDACKVIRIKEVHSFSVVMSFDEYVDYFYKKRLAAIAKGDKAQDIFTKLLMNSLYGKFASNPDKYREWILATEERLQDWFSEGYVITQEFGTRWLMERALQENKKRWYSMATAASITGFVRAHLWRSLNRCSGLLYCDTDSIVAKDVQRLDIGDNLGQWKIEAQCDRYAIAGKKLYAFHTVDGEYKKACKGVNLTAQEIERVAGGEEIEYVPDVPTYSMLRAEPIVIKRQVRKTANVN